MRETSLARQTPAHLAGADGGEDAGEVELALEDGAGGLVDPARLAWGLAAVAESLG